MKLLIFNDSQSIEVQAINPVGNNLYIRMIHVTPEELKNLFKDAFMTKRLTLKDGGKEVAIYENYTTFDYIKEDAGGIFEVGMIQEGKDAETRLTEVEVTATEAKDTADATVTAMQEAIAELTILISTLTAGGAENV